MSVHECVSLSGFQSLCLCLCAAPEHAYPCAGGARACVVRLSVKGEQGKGASVALKVFLVAQSLAGQEKLALRAELDACRAANRDEKKAWW